MPCLHPRLFDAPEPLALICHERPRVPRSQVQLSNVALPHVPPRRPLVAVVGVPAVARPKRKVWEGPGTVRRPLCAIEAPAKAPTEALAEAPAEALVDGVTRIEPDSGLDELWFERDADEPAALADGAAVRRGTSWVAALWLFATGILGTAVGGCLAAAALIVATSVQ